MYLEEFRWCKKNLALGDCPADGPGVKSDTRKTHGIAGLHPAYRLHVWHAAAAVLDGGDSGLPPPAQYRARFLFSVSGAVLFLWRFAPGAELADLLPPAARGAQSVCNRHHFHRTLHVARAPYASAYGIRRNARPAQK